MDVKYMHDKGVPKLLERLAAAIMYHRPENPELFASLFFNHENNLSHDGAHTAIGHKISVFGRVLDPFCSLVLLAACYAGFEVDYIEVTQVIQDSPAFQQISPLQRVPAVIFPHDKNQEQVSMCDTRAIVSHIFSVIPAAAASPADEDTFGVIVGDVLPAVLNAVELAYYEPRRTGQPLADITVLQPVAAAIKSALTKLIDTGRIFPKSKTSELECQLYARAQGSVHSKIDLALGAVAFTMKYVVGRDIFDEGNIKTWFDELQSHAFYKTGLQRFRATAVLHSKNLSIR